MRSDSNLPGVRSRFCPDADPGSSLPPFLLQDFGNDTMLSEALNATAGELGLYFEGVGAQNVTSDRICNASQQVVAGLNFRVTFSPDCADPDAPRLNLTIFRDLQG